MAAAALSIRSRTAIPTDVGLMWKEAIDRYEKITLVKIELLAQANNVEEILTEIHEREMKFKSHRHDGSRLDKFRSIVSKSLYPIEKVGEIVASAALTVRQ